MMKVYQRFILVLFVLIAVCVFASAPSGAQDGKNSKITFYVH